MIIEIENDVIKLIGKLNKNVWPATQAASAMIIGSGIKNIIIDCSGISSIDEDGLNTFAGAFKYMTRKNVRIIFTSVDDKIVDLAKRTIGVRSQMPIANSIEDARESFALDNLSKNIKLKENLLLFPMVANWQHAMDVVNNISSSNRVYNFLYPIIVPLSYTLYHPLRYLELLAEEKFNIASGYCIFNNLVAKKSLVRCRSYKSFFNGIKDKYINSRLVISLVGLELESNFSEGLDIFNLERTYSMVVNSPNNEIKKKYSKILVYYNESIDTSLKLAARFADFNSKIEVLKIESISRNESLKGEFEDIDGFEIFSKEVIRNFNVSARTTFARDKYRNIFDYTTKNNFDCLIISDDLREQDFISNIMLTPPTMTAILSKGFFDY